MDFITTQQTHVSNYCSLSHTQYVLIDKFKRASVDPCRYLIEIRRIVKYDLSYSKSYK
jgi:hypothetical protein